MEHESGNVQVESHTSVDMAELIPAVAEDARDVPVAEDLDSQPLNDLGVSVMDQDVLERNVAAQVCHSQGSSHARLMRLCLRGTTSWIQSDWRKLRLRKSTHSER
jgi:hypothetical protein